LTRKLTNNIKIPENENYEYISKFIGRIPRKLEAIQPFHIRHKLHRHLDTKCVFAYLETPLGDIFLAGTTRTVYAIQTNMLNPPRDYGYMWSKEDLSGGVNDLKKLKVHDAINLIDADKRSVILDKEVFERVKAMHLLKRFFESKGKSSWLAQTGTPVKYEGSIPIIIAHLNSPPIGVVIIFKWKGKSAEAWGIRYDKINVDGSKIEMHRAIGLIEAHKGIVEDEKLFEKLKKDEITKQV